MCCLWCIFEFAATLLFMQPLFFFLAYLSVGQQQSDARNLIAPLHTVTTEFNFHFITPKTWLAHLNSICRLEFWSGPCGLQAKHICGLTWSSPISFIWLLQNLVQQSGDHWWVGKELCPHLWCYSLWAEQDLCSWGWNYVQGLHQPLTSVCSVLEYQTSLDFSEQMRRPGRFCWLTSSWGNQIQLKKPFLSHQGKKLWAMAVHLQGPQALTLFQSYTSAEWSNTYVNCTAKSNPWALANLPEGHNTYLKRGGKEKGSCTPLPHKIRAQQSFAATVTVKSMCSWDDQLQYQQQIHLLKEDSEIWVSTLAFCVWQSCLKGSRWDLGHPSPALAVLC